MENDENKGLMENVRKDMLSRGMYPVAVFRIPAEMDMAVAADIFAGTYFYEESVMEPFPRVNFDEMAPLQERKGRLMWLFADLNVKRNPEKLALVLMDAGGNLGRSYRVELRNQGDPMFGGDIKETTTVGRLLEDSQKGLVRPAVRSFANLLRRFRFSHQILNS